MKKEKKKELLRLSGISVAIFYVQSMVTRKNTWSLKMRKFDASVKYEKLWSWNMGVCIGKYFGHGIEID